MVETMISAKKKKDQLETDPVAQRFGEVPFKIRCADVRTSRDIVVGKFVRRVIWADASEPSYQGRKIVSP